MKFREIILILSFLCVTSSVCAAPLLPTEFYGTVYIDGAPAPAGTNITSVIDNQVTGFAITTAPGVFGGYGPLDPRLSAVGTADGQEITFGINGVTAHETAAFHPGTTGQLTLSTGAAPVIVTVTPGAVAAPTEKPVIDDINYNTNDDYRQPFGSSQAGVSAQAQASTTQKQPATSPVRTTPAGTSKPSAQLPSSGGQPAIGTPGAGGTSQPGIMSIIPGYAVAGLIVLVVVFVGYSVYRRYTRWQ